MTRRALGYEPCPLPTTKSLAGDPPRWATEAPGSPDTTRTGPPRAGQRSGAKRRRRRLLVTTKTDENAMAAPAIIGDSDPAAASGIAATL